MTSEKSGRADGAGDAPVDSPGDAPVDSAGDAPVDSPGAAPADGTGDASTDGTGDAGTDGTGDACTDGTGDVREDRAGDDPAGGAGVTPDDRGPADTGAAPGTDANPLVRVLLVLALAVVVGVVAALVSDVPVRVLGGFHGGGMEYGPGMGASATMGTPFEPLVQVKVFLSTFNLVVLLALGWSYLSLYRDLPNRFTGSLLLVTGALFLYALASNPVVSLVFGYRGNIGLGPFTFLPDLFAAVAVTVLLYQSYQ